MADDERRPLQPEETRRGGCVGGPAEIWLRLFVRVLALCVGVALFAVGGFQLYPSVKSLVVSKVETYILSFYILLFGIVVILCEIFTTHVFYKYFAMMFTWFGRGIFYIFAGTLCFGLEVDNIPLGIILGVSIICVGCFLILMGFVFWGADGPQPLFPACACCGVVADFNAPPSTSGRSRGYEELDSEDEEEMVRRERRRR